MLIVCLRLREKREIVMACSGRQSTSPDLGNETTPMAPIVSDGKYTL